MTLAPLRLKPREHHRLRAGHLWVFSNEVDIKATPLTGFEPGQPVVVQDAAGQPLGSGYVNPHSLICARLVSRDPEAVLDRNLIVARLRAALLLRARLFAQPFYRLAFGEADGLPGLVVDRYGDVVVAQLTTAGMERVKAEVVAALVELLAPRAILLRNDGASRQLEGLPSYVETARGEVPETTVLEENGTRFEIPLLHGQKTGWFYDQRPNRTRLRAYVAGRRVLDVFSYVGAWGVQAAAAGAREVLCVDSSERAVALARANAGLNQVADKVTVSELDAFDALKGLRADGERFDVVVLDPPALIKRKKDIKEGTRAYHRLNELAVELLADDGLLVSASCSYHLSREALQDVLLRASRAHGRELQLLEQGGQAPDHPIHPAIPETAYLKALFARLRP
ncbi:MAG: class I SAM-dependent rRNA methyltransferase [Gammaproteobacteria bacterium]|nr:class I SAM-dependent rRNA methyltransferase [Gammaproteobacteria bacterium]